jgi:hypothetical protein
MIFKFKIACDAAESCLSSVTVESKLTSVIDTAKSKLSGVVDTAEKMKFCT